ILLRKAFGAGIAFSLIIFLFVPFRFPSVETYFAPHHRPIPFHTVFKERALSVYNLGNSRLQAMYTVGMNTSSELEKSKSQGINTFFFDPTFPLVARAVQPKTNTRITALQLHVGGNYLWFEGLEQGNSKGVSVMLSTARIASRKDFADKYLLDFPLKNRYDIGELSFFEIEEAEAARLAVRYDSLFSKR
ncbi:MAG TPA: hypothetical protein VEC36_08720, partial [Patescibacteria group bacterium]|nr:hypothetical protein [Patescibacteria group bacterium]